MSKNTSILVATIGTRDLAFQVSSGEWLNIGNDRAPDPKSISEQALVQVDLGLENFSFRALTEYLLNHWDDYHETELRKQLKLRKSKEYKSPAINKMDKEDIIEILMIMDVGKTNV